MSLSNLGYYGVYADEHWKREQFQKDLVFCPEERESASIAIDSNSIVRNSVNAVKAVTALPAIAVPFVAGSSIFGGVLGAGVGLSIVRDACIKGKAALQSGDLKSLAHHATYGISGAGYVGVSSILAADGVMGLQGASLPLAFTPAISGLGIVMSAAILAYSGYGISVATQFKNEMKGAMREGGERAVLNLLNRQISLSPSEIRGATDEEMAKSLQTKWNALERKVGVAAARMIREKLPDLLKNFDVDSARVFIREVEKANFKERVRHAILIVIGIISAIAFAGILLTTGPFSSILFAVGAVIWLAVDSSRLHEYIGEKCWAWHSEKEESPPCQIHIAS